MARSGQREQTGLMDREAPTHGLCLKPSPQRHMFYRRRLICFVETKEEEPMKIPL